MDGEKKMKSNYIFPIIVLVLSVAGVIGWIINFAKLIGIMHADISSEFILRIIGLFVLPFGSIMGYM